MPTGTKSTWLNKTILSVCENSTWLKHMLFGFEKHPDAGCDQVGNQTWVTHFAIGNHCVTVNWWPDIAKEKKAVWINKKKSEENALTIVSDNGI